MSQTNDKFRTLTITEAEETAHKLSQTMGNLYIWKETKGQPIKWMKVTK